MIQYSDDAKIFLTLVSAKVLNVKLDESKKLAEVSVAPDQFSLAIGRNGQNVRLAAELTGWRIDVVAEGGKQEMSSDEVKVEEEAKTEVAPETVEPEKKDE